MTFVLGRKTHLLASSMRRTSGCRLNPWGTVAMERPTHCSVGMGSPVGSCRGSMPAPPSVNACSGEGL